MRPRYSARAEQAVRAGDYAAPAQWPKTTASLPCRWDELQALEDLGLVRSEQTGSGQEDTWSIDRTLWPWSAAAGSQLARDR